jgi:hypothetical protein
MNTREQDKDKARKQTQMLVELRKQHDKQVKQAQALLKEQQAVRKVLERALQEGPRSVPQLSKETGVPAHEVLWHMAEMRKYDVVEESGMDEDGDYYLYCLTKEATS